MLRVHKQEKARFKMAKEIARKVGLVQQFARVLRYLNSYAEHERGVGFGISSRPQVRVTLEHDFAPHSFSIVWERRQGDGSWKYWFNGGLIYHGPHDNGGDGGGPTFSVNLNPTHGWTVHT